MTQSKYNTSIQQTYPQSSYLQNHQYTYFDSITKKYLDQRRKNQVKKQQNRIQVERRQLAKCTFKPAIKTKNYNQVSKKLAKLKQQVKAPEDKQQISRKSQKNLPYQRLLDWGTRKQLKNRHKLIQRQLQLINLTKSVSRQKSSFHKLNRSLEQAPRLDTQQQTLNHSIKAVPIIPRQQLNSSRNNYRTLQSYKRISHLNQ